MIDQDSLLSYSSTDEEFIDLDEFPISRDTIPLDASSQKSPGTREMEPLDYRLREQNFWVFTGSIISLVALIALLGLSFSSESHRSTKKERLSTSSIKNVIFMIPDGFGPSSQTFARVFYKEVYGKKEQDFTLPLDRILVGSVRTRSASSIVTDSAAGGTAFGCGIKTDNHVIGFDIKGKKCANIIEAVHRDGYLTGLVSTARITHATPAAFSSHVKSRDNEESIAIQQILGSSKRLKRTIDLMFGGGACVFIPENVTFEGFKGCRRSDKRNLFREATKFNWNVKLGRSEFDQLSIESAKIPLISLFANDHMSFEVDRSVEAEPSLAEMTLKALRILDHKLLESFKSQSLDNQKKGFFILIEGARVDMAAHLNDPVAHLHDILQYNEAVKIAKHYVDSHPGTVLISVADHETGGLSVSSQVGSRPKYEWKPIQLAHIRRSMGDFAIKISKKLFEINVSWTAAKGAYSRLIEEQENAIESILENGLHLKSFNKIQNTNAAENLQRNMPVYPPRVEGAYQDIPPDQRPNDLDHPSYYYTNQDVQWILKLANLSNFDLDSDQGEVFNPSIISPLLTPLTHYLGSLVSKASQTGWTTHGHSGVDVNLYAYFGAEEETESSHFSSFEYSQKSIFQDKDKEFVSRNLSKFSNWYSNEYDSKYRMPWKGALSQEDTRILSQLKFNLENTQIAHILERFLSVNMTLVSHFLK